MRPKELKSLEELMEYVEEQAQKRAAERMKEEDRVLR